MTHFQEKIMHTVSYRIHCLILLIIAWTAGAETIEHLPNAYRNMELGMNIDQVKELLKDDPWFDYRGDPPVSLSDNPNESLIETGGSLFIDRALFQFKSKSLTAIVLELSAQNLDWFTVYSTLENQYGSPLLIDPDKAWWEDEDTRLALERPLTIKYLDIEIYAADRDIESNQKAWKEAARTEFLNAF